MEETSNEGLGLAEAAGLTGEDAAGKAYNFMESFWHYFQEDMISSIPITICSILIVTAIIERLSFYSKNRRDISKFIHNLQLQLEKSDLESAQILASQLGGVTGEVAEEGIRLLAVQKEDFSRAYDITVSIVTRKLQKYLPVLATVGAIAPFLGLFGTVSGVIKSLFRMAQGSEGASLTMIGEISNALIATGYGLVIAIFAVVFNNIFNNMVKRFNDDFVLLKLLFLSFSNVQFDQNAIDRYDQTVSSQGGFGDPSSMDAGIYNQIMNPDSLAKQQVSQAVNYVDQNMQNPHPNMGVQGAPGQQQDRSDYPDFLK